MLRLRARVVVSVSNVSVSSRRLGLGVIRFIYNPAQSWVTKTVWQRIPGRRARSSETPTTITVQSIPRNDHLPLTGGLQVLTTDVGCLCAIFRQVQQSCSIRASVIMLTAQNRQLCPCLVQCVDCCYHGNYYFCFFDILSFNTIHIVGGTGTWQKHVFGIRV